MVIWKFSSNSHQIGCSFEQHELEYQNSPNGTDRCHIKDSMFRLQSKDKGALVLSAITQLHRRPWRTSSFKSVRPQNSNSWKQSVENVIRLVFVIMHKVKTCRLSSIRRTSGRVPHQSCKKTLIKICPITKIWLPWNYFNKWELQHIASWNTLCLRSTSEKGYLF